MSFDVDPEIKKSSNPLIIVIDDFFPEDLAYNLSNEFIDFDSDKWFYHDNIC